MMPGCKVGDIAYMNKQAKGVTEKTYGKFTKIIKREDADNGDIAWRVDPPLHKPVTGYIGDIKHTFPGDWIRDKHLNPIRDQPGEDEMIRIAGKPKEIENV